MSLRDEIALMRETVLERVQEAARNGSTRDVVSASRLLEATEDLLGIYDSVVTRFEDIKAQLNGAPNRAGTEGTSDRPANGALSAKAKGEVRRQAFLRDAETRGISLTRIRGVRYSSPKLQRVGIASANESPDYRNRWFLGLAPDKYDGFVLLCEDLTGQVHRFIASSEVSRRVLPYLSRDSAGQLKFHVTRDKGRFYLDVPSSNQESIDGLLERFEDL